MLCQNPYTWFSWFLLSSSREENTTVQSTGSKIGQKIYGEIKTGNLEKGGRKSLQLWWAEQHCQDSRGKKCFFSLKAGDSRFVCLVWSYLLCLLRIMS